MPVDEPGRDRPEPPDGKARSARPPGIPSRRILVALGVVIVALDQTTKAAVRALLPLYDSITVIPGFLDFTYVRNTGAAFGLLNAADVPYKPVIMTGIALVALIAIGIYAGQTQSQEPLGRLGLALVIAGAVGNLIDRVTVGFVVDFVDVYWQDWHFWAFNVADSAITIGAGLLIVDMLLGKQNVPETV